MPPEPSPLPRRTFIAGALAATAAACSSGASRATDSSAPSSASTPSAGSTASSSAESTRFVSAGPRDRQQVALTFHVSGDRDLAVRLLDLLRGHTVTITAFMVGSWLEANADLAKRFLDEGHELANHTYNHLTFPSLTRSAMVTEVDRCRDALTRVAGSAGQFFRPSGTSNGTGDPGPTVRDVAHAAGYATIAGFDVDPSDYADPGARAVADRTIAAVQPGSIVSLHFGHTGTIEALPQILDALGRRQLQPVNLGTLLS